MRGLIPYSVHGEALRARIQSSGLSCAEQVALAPLNPNHIKVKVYDRAKYGKGFKGDKFLGNTFIFLNFPITQGDNAFCIFNNAWVVRSKNEGGICFFVELFHNIHNLFAVFCI